MNSKLNELRLDAGIARIENYQWLCVLDKKTGMMVDPLIGLEKFAELIVAECASVALEQKKWVEDQKIHNLEDESWNRARIQQSQHIVDKIKQHFGVEL